MKKVIILLALLITIGSTYAKPRPDISKSYKCKHIGISKVENHKFENLVKTKPKVGKVITFPRYRHEEN